MDTFKKKLEIILTLAILIGVGLYISGHFESKAPDPLSHQQVLRDKLAAAQTSEERFEIISQIEDQDLMRRLAEQEAEKILKTGDVRALEKAMREHAEIGRMIGGSPQGF